jgi:alkylation response protein AidB-like acyl-CoA dehydrogenase
MMHHPSSLLSAELVSSIRAETTTAENGGQLTPVQIDIIRRHRWFQLFVPKELHGLDLSLPEAVRLEESLAWTDGSVGWVVTLCAGAAMFVGYLDKDFACEIFSDPHACLAGSGQVTGTARQTDQGFIINGAWDYSSGAPHATHFTANCAVEGIGVRSFIFLRKEVTLTRNWDYMGLNATAGHSYSVSNLEVPRNRCFLIDPSAAVLPGPVYRYPFLQLAYVTLAANVSGMCVYFLDLAAELMRDDAAKHRLKQAQATMQMLREEFYTTLDHSWQLHISNKLISPEDVNTKSLALAQRSRECVDFIYPFCGLTAARNGSAINQVWRNIHTASQHALLTGDV